MTEDHRTISPRLGGQFQALRRKIAEKGRGMNTKELNALAEEEGVSRAVLKNWIKEFFPPEPEPPKAPERRQEDRLPNIAAMSAVQLHRLEEATQRLRELEGRMLVLIERAEKAWVAVEEAVAYIQQQQTK